MRFAIIALPQMGANRLTRVLRTHPEVLCRDNIFHPNRLDRFLRKADPERHGRGDLRERADPGILLELAFKPSNKRKQVGFAIFDGENEAVLQAVLKDASIGKIVAYRKNMLAAYVSSAAARNGSTPEAPRRKGTAGQPKIRFVPDDFAAFRDRCNAFYRYIIEQLAIRDGPFHIVNYDEIHDPLLISVLLRFVGADALEDRETQAFLKLAEMRRASDIVALFANADQVRAFLDQNGLSHWACEGGASFEHAAYGGFCDGVDLNALNVELVRPDSAADIAEKAQKYDLPHLGTFLDDISARLSGDQEAYGRRYQREAVRERGLALVSPLSGRVQAAIRSFFVHGRIFYRFSESADYYVASSRIKLGYPLTALFVPRANCLIKWDSLDGAMELRHVKLLASLIARHPRPPGGHPTPTIVMGHDNFAHHMWNELSALERLIAEDCPKPPPRLIVRRETLGDLEKIFPELNGWDIVRPSGETWHLGNEADTLYVNLGGYRISSGLRLRIVRHAKAQASAAANALIREVRMLGAPVFWMSVRTANPTLANQSDVLIAIALRILERYAGCCILFDGFSPPHDTSRAGFESLSFYAAAVQAAKDEVDATIKGVLTRRRPSGAQMIRNVAGLGVLDSIALAQLADGYFCHLGTTQHKIGWTANRPGIIHASRTLLATRPEVWHANAIEGGIQPLAIPEELIEDLAPGQRDGSYRALDCDVLARWVLNRFEESLRSAPGTIGATP